MLSNAGIEKFLRSGDIVIDPWHDEMMGAARVTLHLGDELLIPEGNAVVDFATGALPTYQSVRRLVFPKRSACFLMDGARLRAWGSP